MAQLHHLKRLILSRYRQFEYAVVDLTEPDTGRAIPDLCLIGPNGSGKSTLLEELYRAVNHDSKPVTPPRDDLADALVLSKHGTDGDDLYLARTPLTGSGDSLVFSVAIEQCEKWSEFAKSPLTFTEFCAQFSEFLVEGPISGRVPGKKSAWFSPLLSLVDGSPADGFDAFLAKRFQDREWDYHQYLKRPGNREKTIAELEQEFDAAYPHVLTALRDMWDKITESSALQFDFSQPTQPVLSGNGGTFSFSHLSTAIQGLLLALGHVYSQYFDQEPREGVLFLDTPENGLHPEIIPSLIPLYRRILPTQRASLFIATHSPLMASQFPPVRRLRLSVNTKGHVTVSPGIAGNGSDTDQILKSDFELGTSRPIPRSSETRNGRYAQLKRAIQESDDQDELADLIDEVMTIRKL